VVIKAQVLSGGRGLGTFKSGFKGGVHMVTKPAQAKEFASHMLGQELVTYQNPQGILCNKVLLMERMYMRREMYLSILMDRTSQGYVPNEGLLFHLISHISQCFTHF
jgi:succinyl-CoA synthetase beta subunit